MTKHGLHDASTDRDQIEAWWSLWPAANIGLRTGVAFDVLDIDGDEGKDSLRGLIGEYRHDGPVSATGKGWHLLFAVTEAKNGANLLPKLDFRGRNGYIVAPPSIHPLGHRYRWDPSRPASRALPAAPEWLRTLLFPPKPERSARTRSPNELPIRTALPGSVPLHEDEIRLYNLQTELEALGCVFTSKGGRLVASCPFHADDTPSLTIYPGSPDTFYCFGCMAWGDVANVRRYQRDKTLR